MKFYNKVVTGVANEIYIIQERGIHYVTKVTHQNLRKIVRLHLEDGRTYKSITVKYGVSKASISKWCAEFSEECQNQAITNPDNPNKTEIMKENLRLRICSNVYYSYQKHRKAGYCAHKAKVLGQIEEIYHEHNGVNGYRNMTVYLKRRSYSYNPATIHKYMMGIRSIVRPKRPGYKHGKPHEVFDNKIN